MANITTDEEETTIRIIAEQTAEIFGQRKHVSRWKSHFYKVVLGGNVDTVKQVVEYMSEHGMTEALDWLLMRETKQSDASTRTDRCVNSARVFFSRVIVFLILAIVNIILSPVFYIVHIITTSLLNTTKRRISVKSNLPLALAVFSQDVDMIRYFLSIGVDIEQVDSEGNNVFHYVADLSATAPGKAINILEIMLEIFKEKVPVATLKKMLVEDRNSAALTVLEYSVKYGSLSFTSNILKLPNMLHESEIAVGRHQVSVTGNILVNAHTRVDLVDVTKYEAGTLADQSLLLNQLSDADILEMTAEDLQLFTKASFISDWMNMKIKQMMPGVIVLQILDIIITLMIVVVALTFISHYEWMNSNYRGKIFAELIALSQNTSVIFKPDIFQRLLQTVPFEKELSEYSREVVTQFPAILQQRITTANVRSIAELFERVFVNMTLSNAADEAWQNISSIGVYSFCTYICMPIEAFSTEDLLPFPVPYPPDFYWDSCDLKMFLDLASETCAGEDRTAVTVYEKYIALFGFNYDNYQNAVLLILLIASSIVYLLLDGIERVVFVYTCVGNHTKASAMFTAFFSKKIPGPYARKQINLCSHAGIIAYLIMFNSRLVKEYRDDEILSTSPENLVFILTLTLRFILHIHSIRLLPGIGHFVISTFMMGVNLAHFSFIFGVVVLSFSGIFHMIADNQTCPLFKEKGYGSIFASMLSTFQLSFGHGEFDAYSSSPALSVSYVLYVVIVGLLLMNLIIAVMSSTAARIMLEPWKGALYKIEWLDEATAVEYTFSVLGLLCRRCRVACRGYASHSNAGFVVKKVDGGCKIYIEKFYCPALDCN